MTPRRGFATSLGLALLSTGCETEPDAVADAGACSSQDCCLDADDDRSGRGPGCKGPDCNDFVYGVSSMAECDAWCAAHSAGAPGCACASEGGQVDCFTGPTDVLGVGSCRGGTSECSDGIFGGCLGEVVPTYEVADGLDNDCDGEIDEP